MANILTLIGVASASSLGDLIPAFKVVQQMTEAYTHIKFGQRRCKHIIQRAALIIRDVHVNLPNDRSNVTKLQGELEEIQTILQKLADMSFFKALLHFEDVNKEIERANSHLNDCAQLFPVIDLSSHVRAQSKAATSDREALRPLIKILAGNYEETRRRFGINSDEQEIQLMAVMERELRNARTTSEDDMPVEIQIMQKSLECIKATTGRSSPKQQKWLITEYDLEYCGTIGGGGFSTVRKAWFRGTMVAVKTLKDVGNMRESLEREIEIWSMLRNDHVVPFYGASTLTLPPFIVSRYMRNGNLTQYLTTTPKADRTKLIFEVSLGMYYLHEESVVHGDLKSVNVLVDDSGKACITDFGLSKIYSSGTAQTRTSKVSGTLRFLAPEALSGGPLSFETDVYAFGMLTYEVFTGEIPFIREPDRMVLEGRVELQRPTSSGVYERGFNDSLWKLLSDCISCDPFARPRFKAIQGQLRSILRKAEPFAGVVYTAIDVDNLTDWGLDSTPLTCVSTSHFDKMISPLEKGKSASVEQTSISSRGSLPHDINTLPPVFAKPLVQSFHLGTEDNNVTDWGLGINPTTYLSPVSIDKTAPFFEQFGESSSAAQDLDSFPPPPAGPSARSTLPAQGNEAINVADLGHNAKSMTSPLPVSIDTAAFAFVKTGKSGLVNQPTISSERPVSRDVKNFPPVLPMCIVVIHKYFGVSFGIQSREPCVRLEKADAVQWQPIRAKKSTLMYVSEQGNRFWYKTSSGYEKNSCELDGNKVTLRTASFKGVCCFKDVETAQKWFRLQLSYARDGSVGEWRTETGDWIYTERSWRRLERGKIQQADLVAKAPNKVPNDRSWVDVKLPKSCTIHHNPSNENSIDCINLPGERLGRLCYKIEQRTIVSEAYRQLSDKVPVATREETYPSREYAEMTFRVLKAALEETTKITVDRF